MTLLYQNQSHAILIFPMTIPSLFHDFTMAIVFRILAIFKNASGQQIMVNLTWQRISELVTVHELILSANLRT